MALFLLCYTCLYYVGVDALLTKSLLIQIMWFCLYNVYHVLCVNISKVIGHVTVTL
jgi:hypothetical protein